MYVLYRNSYKDLSLNKQENTKITLSKLEFAKNIEFKNVSFRYNKDNLIFEKLNLEIHKNEKLEFLGILEMVSQHF